MDTHSLKELLGKEVAKRVKSGQILGIGSGSTTELAITAIGRRIHNGEIKDIYGIPTSFRSAQLASEAGIKILDINLEHSIDWAFDGADEVDSKLNMIKGGGGALLNEKIVAKRAGGLLVVVTANKLVKTLGQNFPLPLEIVPSALPLVKKELQTISLDGGKLRKATNKYGPVVTEHGNLILDIHIENLTPELNDKIKLITGVVESGFFSGLANEVLVADNHGVSSLGKTT